MLSAQEIAGMRATVTGALDVTVTVQRRTATPDGYGHTTEVWTTTSTPKCNIFKPTSSTLQKFADVIGSQWALMLRILSGTDIREGDRILYAGRTWLVQNVQDAESYTVCLEILMTVLV